MNPSSAWAGHRQAAQPVRAGFGHYQPLLAYARDPDDPRVHAYASALDMARTSTRMVGRSRLGLGEDSYLALLDRHFPDIPASYRKTGGGNCHYDHDEFDDLLHLLLAHSQDNSPDNRWLAHAVTTGCMGDDHLWQDLGLANRQVLSDLLAREFPELYARNTQGMRWKKFFYRQLCLSTGVKVCRSPSCEACSEYTQCFGSEEDDVWQK